MPGEKPTGTGQVEDVRARIIAAMRDLELPSPDRMLSRIERMLDEKDRDRVLRQLLEGFRKDSPDEMKRVLKVLTADGADWAREVDRMLANYRPIA